MRLPKIPKDIAIASEISCELGMHLFPFSADANNVRSPEAYHEIRNSIRFEGVNHKNLDWHSDLLEELEPRSFSGPLFRSTPHT